MRMLEDMEPLHVRATTRDSAVLLLEEVVTRLRRVESRLCKLMVAEGVDPQMTPEDMKYKFRRAAQ